MFAWVNKITSALGLGPETAEVETAPAAAAPSAPLLPDLRLLPPLPVATWPTAPPPRAILSPLRQAPPLPGRAVRSLDPAALHHDILTDLDSLAIRAGSVTSGRAESNQRFIERLHVLVTRDRLNLPPFPDIVRELDLALRNPDVDLAVMARLVERDPGLVRRVWEYASGAEYGSRPRNLHHAITRLGTNQLWKIGMMVLLRDGFLRVPGYTQKAERVRDLAFETGETAARLLGDARGSGFLAGLLHDVGQLVVLQAAALPRPAALPDDTFVEEVIQRVHSTLGVLVAQAWNLPDDVAAAIGYHHDPDEAPFDYRHLAIAVRAADIGAQATLALGENPPEMDEARVEIASLGFEPQTVFDTVHQARATRVKS